MTFKKIKLVTDSTCDLPKELIEKWDITVVPVFVHIGDESYADDGEQLDRVDYYNRLPNLNPLPTTSAPSPGLAQQYIETAFEDADHLVIVSLASKLSATYEALRLGAGNLPPERVTLIDSGNTTMALGFQALIGAEVAAATGDVDQVIAAIHRARPHIELRALITSLENLRRSGRVNFAQAGIGALLQIKPIITIEDGVVQTMARVRTMSRAREELVEMIRQQAPLDRIALLHTNNLEGLEWIRGQVSEYLPSEVLTINVTTAIGTHIGANCLGFVSVSSRWKQ
ncbi:MAG: DegV family protein [Anaerolineae bacterium]|nr:DegV family protein [Anaerolineae bacterium]